MKDLITGLTALYGPSGHEQHVRRFIAEQIASHVDSMEVDAMGNLHAIKNGTGGGQTVMLAAHMDEIGLMVSHVEDEGAIRFTNLGTLIPVRLVGARVVFANGATGVLDIEDRTARPDSGPAFKNLYIDTGASSRDECPVSVGDVGAFFGPAVGVGRRMMGKSMDNRAGCAAQIETLKRLSHTPHRLHAVFTVQEEVGIRGAATGAFKVAPDIAIALDVTPAGDVPGDKNHPIKLGGGPAIKIKDLGSITHPVIKEWMIETARANHIPYQPEVMTIGYTDARAMQLAKGGAAAGNISIPCRHVHSPSEVIDLDDLENTVKLLAALLSEAAPPALR
ncbi:MAG: M42 family metallopeptidase [Anaerolineae bacterium]